MCCLTVKLPSLAQRIASSHYKGSADKDEDEDDVDAEYADTDAAGLREEGDAVRVGGDQDIGRVNCPGFLLSVWGKRFLRCLNHSWWRCGGEGGEGRNNSGHEEPEDGQGGKRKRKRKQKNCGWWRDDTGGPVVTRKAGEVPSQLLTISLPHHCQAMEIILADHENSFKDIDDSSNTVETSVAVVNQFALNVCAFFELLNSFSLFSNHFHDWLSCGQKLTLLCAGRTLYLLTIIAALDMRTCITWQCGEDDILSIANTLREVKYGILPQLPLFYNVPKPVGEAPETYQYHFRNIVQLDTVLTVLKQTIQNFLLISGMGLPDHSVLDSVSLPEFTAIPSNTIKTPVQTGTLGLNGRAPVQLNVIHAGGKRKEIYSHIPQQPLFIRDANDKLLSLVFTVPDSIRQSLEDAILHLEAAMPGEFREEDSQQEKFNIILPLYMVQSIRRKRIHRSCHVHRTIYAKTTMAESTSPRDSRTKPRRLLNTGGAFHPFFEYLRPQLRHLLPEEYAELDVYIEVLPLSASCPSAPFGGFVVNVNSCTWGHRDVASCAFYEAGLVFDLQLGDVLVFPSQDLTHFNLHFKGKRGTLVLHTDRQSKALVNDCNGWSVHVADMVLIPMHTVTNKGTDKVTVTTMSEGSRNQSPNVLGDSSAYIRKAMSYNLQVLDTTQELQEGQMLTKLIKQKAKRTEVEVRAFQVLEQKADESRLGQTHSGVELREHLAAKRGHKVIRGATTQASQDCTQP
ncbi:hypothetical protein B0H10DRAFT_1945267 [Mycena sp. CBHHK59/15]|nr:hypothetical protein B0H10DRAFT_1945267 [Mycena sp. CBHHK59/15]